MGFVVLGMICIAIALLLFIEATTVHSPPWDKRDHRDDRGSRKRD